MTVTINSILIYGPSGCGKSFWTEAILSEIPGIHERGCSRLNTRSFLSDPEKQFDNLRAAMERFEFPALVIEDIDALLCDLTSHSAQRGLLRELIRDPGFVVVGTARNPDTMQVADLQAFSVLIPVLLPTEEDRREILAKFGNLQEGDLQFAASGSVWWSCMEVKALAEECQQSHQVDLEKRVRDMTQSINTEARKKRHEVLVAFTRSHCQSGELYEAVQKSVGGADLSELTDGLDLKPGMFGVSIDIKKVFGTLTNILKNR